MDRKNIEVVRKFYNGACETEWNRLDKEPFEFELTTYRWTDM